jgi:ABC-type sugar transport system substrate-binding protein
MGHYAGQIIEEKWNGQATVLILAVPGLPASDNRTNGIEEAIRGLTSQANILPEVEGNTREEAYSIVRQYLQQNIDINVIVSINDAAAVGAVDALQEANIPPEDVDIVSANAEPPTLDLIRQGTFIRGSLAINREQLSHLAIYGVIKQLAGATIPEYFSYPPGDMITSETLAAETPQ